MENMNIGMIDTPKKYSLSTGIKDLWTLAKYCTNT
jgi:hypothetical protein